MADDNRVVVVEFAVVRDAELVVGLGLDLPNVDRFAGPVVEAGCACHSELAA